MNIFDIADIYYNINDSHEDKVNESLITMSYCTSLDHPNRHFKFIDLYNSDNEEDKELLRTLINIHSQVVKELKEHQDYSDSSDKIDFSFRYKQNDTVINLRANYTFITDGYCLNLRTKPPVHPYLEDMDLPAAIKEILLSESLTDGLVLFTAETGQGKTTTAVATTASRIRKYGGHCNAYEDPPEYNMQGFHGKNGYICQTDVHGNFSEYIKASLRKFPITKGSILFVGEIRDPETAYNALQASAQGNLVIGTVHGMDIQSTFKRLITYVAGRKGGSVEVAADMLSSSFRFIFHQYKVRNPNGQDWEKFVIDGEVFYALTKETKSQIANAIKESNFQSLTTIIEKQNKVCERFNKGEVTKDELFNAQTQE